MGQSASVASRSSSVARRSFSNFSPLMADEEGDRTFDLPDDCLASVFQSLAPSDRSSCSLVCKRWLLIEGQSRHRISIDARAVLFDVIPRLFSRFDSVTKLALKCDRRSDSIGDEALTLISSRCINLTRLKIRACRGVTEAGMISLGKNCQRLKKLSCGSCAFGSRGINAILGYCPLLEELSIKRLRGDINESVGGVGSFPSLKIVCLKEIYNGHCFAPLISASPNLKTLKLFRCSGDWDELFEELPGVVPGLTEVHLEKINIGDRGLSVLSACVELEVLNLVRTAECTNKGLAFVAERCRLLRKVHIDGAKANRIGDEGLAAIARRCPNLQELVLIGVNPTALSLGLIAANCQNLERLALCGSETIGDAEISCIAAKCLALKKLCIKGCPVSNHAIEALAEGCPNLVKVKVKKCKGVTGEVAEWLRSIRVSLAVSLDIGNAQVADQPEENVQDPVLLLPRQMADMDLPSTSSGTRPVTPKSRWRFFGSRNFMVSTFRRLSQHGNGKQPNS